MSQRLDFMAFNSALLKKYTDFSLAFKLDKSLSLLVDIRASQLNGCAFCLDMHVKQSALHRERPLRVHHIAVWRESPLFTPKERAALEWTEALTLLGREGVSDAVYRAVREQFNEDELLELTFRVMAINGWNRLNVAFQTVPGSKDKVLGLERAGID
jgi:AhpD family alkylhydroperoxidase